MPGGGGGRPGGRGAPGGKGGGGTFVGGRPRSRGPEPGERGLCDRKPGQKSRCEGLCSTEIGSPPARRSGQSRATPKTIFQLIRLDEMLPPPRS